MEGHLKETLDGQASPNTLGPNPPSPPAAPSTAFLYEDENIAAAVSAAVAAAPAATPLMDESPGSPPELTEEEDVQYEYDGQASPNTLGPNPPWPPAAPSTAFLYEDENIAAAVAAAPAATPLMDESPGSPPEVTEEEDVHDVPNSMLNLVVTLEIFAIEYLNSSDDEDGPWFEQNDEYEEDPDGYY
ncbi:translation initiation factor IF-2-like [Drosophila pseudoobscura]|uniref:Translation initiation factor IF-2-like n=1 Tax=Drosophila pseudoobscura pseudoobscura TaxID=46245 RepID=B5DL51_DROPS|nr:translation initiation factor IF-2 [Drosophila pseudoobscura]